MKKSRAEGYLKPFKRPKKYYEDNNLFIVSLPPNMRQNGEYEYCLGKDIFNCNSNWAGNLALKRMKVKYNHSPFRNLEENAHNRISSYGSSNEPPHFSERDSRSSDNSFRICENGDIGRHFSRNDCDVERRNFSFENKGQDSKITFFKAGTSMSNERKSSSLAGSFNEPCSENRTAFGSFPHLKQNTTNKVMDVPVPHISVENMIIKIKQSHPTIVVFLDLDFYTKFLWKLKKQLSSGVHIIMFYGKKNRVRQNLNSSLSELHQSERFHLHPLVGIKSKGSCAKNLSKTAYLADKELPKEVSFVIMCSRTTEVQKCFAEISGRGRNCVMIPKSSNVMRDFYNIAAVDTET
ncbi:uncharacterized protein [Centruroides vittatus]|uniref:uncharacterized protein isoform X1 n=1 Tax=Centruroides vittatus TaxID=120091 RepID=UPI00350F297F